LTGLANRRIFREQFQRNMLHAKREKESLFLAVIDIDHFKLYNDLYGHQAGDEVLRLVGTCWRTMHAACVDLAVRLGGEQFALGRRSKMCSRCASAWKSLIDLHGLNLAHDAAHCGSMSPWSGLAQVRDEDTVDTVFKPADSPLFQAKEQGRNQVCGVASIAMPVINPRRPSRAQQAAAIGPAS
jgi:two-component system chemotaxis family response regulator WspR